MQGDGAEAEAGSLEEMTAGEGLLVFEERGEIHLWLGAWLGALGLKSKLRRVRVW